MILILKLLFSSLRFIVLARAVNSTDDTITITYKDVNDCSGVGPETLKAFLTYYAECAFKRLGGTSRKLSSHTKRDVFEAAQADHSNDHQNQEEHRRLLSCSNCKPYCNCRLTRPQSNCGVNYPVCSLFCDCQRRRNLIFNTISLDFQNNSFSLRPATFMEPLDEKTFENYIRKEGSSGLEREMLRRNERNDLWTCACTALEANGIDGLLFLPIQTETMCKCKNKTVDVWTNAY